MYPHQVWDFIKTLGWRQCPKNVIFEVEGTIVDDLRKYKNVGYTRLLGPNGDIITLKVPSQFWDFFKKQAPIKVKGIPYLDFKPEFGKAEVVLTVHEVL